MNQSTYPKCRTCKHWSLDPYKRGGHMGKCEAIGKTWTPKWAFICTVIERGDLITGPDFGCCLHTPLEGGKEE